MTLAPLLSGLQAPQEAQVVLWSHIPAVCEQGEGPLWRTSLPPHPIPEGLRRDEQCGVLLLGRNTPSRKPWPAVPPLCAPQPPPQSNQ